MQPCTHSNQTKPGVSLMSDELSVIILNPALAIFQIQNSDTFREFGVVWENKVNLHIFQELMLCFHIENT